MRRIYVTHFFFHFFIQSASLHIYSPVMLYFWKILESNFDTGDTLLKNLILNLVFGVRLLVTAKLVVNRLCWSRALYMCVLNAGKPQLSLEWLQICMFLPWIYRCLRPIPVRGNPCRHTHSILLLGSYLVVTVYKRLFITLYC